MTIKPASQPHRQDVMLQMLADYASHELMPSAHAACRSLWFAQLGVSGEAAFPTAISADTWGLTPSRLHGIPPKLDRVLIDRILVESTILKLVPGQRNGTTAIEAAIRLHASVAPRLAEVKEVRVYTHDEAMRRINVVGPLPNAEARDHCLQYMVAAALIYGRISNWHYSDEAAAHPQLEALRARVWRAVEAQHKVSTMRLVDNSLADQAILENILETSKPPVPEKARDKHWLIFTPFRYTPPRPGSRFRAPQDPGVFYGALEQRTACAEIGYWRGLFAPKGIAAEHVAYWEDVLRKVTATKEWKEDLERNFWSDDFVTSAQFRKDLDKDYADIKAVLVDIGLARP